MASTQGVGDVHLVEKIIKKRRTKTEKRKHGASSSESDWSDERPERSRQRNRQKVNKLRRRGQHSSQKSPVWKCSGEKQRTESDNNTSPKPSAQLSIEELGQQPKPSSHLPGEKQRTESDNNTSPKPSAQLSIEELGQQPKPSSHLPGSRQSKWLKSRSRKQNPNTARKRKQVKCCIENCDGMVVNLGRHIREVHKDIPEFEVQKVLKEVKRTPKRKYRIFTCSEEGCGWKGTWPDKHLVSKHGFEKQAAKIKNKQIKISSAQCSRQGDHSSRFPNMHTAESLSEDFLDWFQSIEGGNFVPDFMEDSKRSQKQKQNKKVKQMVQTILLTCLGEGEFHESALSILSTIGRPTKKGDISLVEKLKKDRAWGTVKNYLNSLTHFVDFTESKKLLMASDTITSIRINLKGSIATVTKFALEELQRRKLSDRDRVLDFDDIKQYRSMNVALSLMKSFDPESSDCADKIHRISRHILLQIALPNGKRTGIFADMKCSDVQMAVQEGGGFVIQVAEGKTFRVSGASGVFCSKQEYNTLHTFISELRPLLNSRTEQVFCRASGERAEVGEIGDFLKDAWSDFGSIISKDIVDLTFTLIRKSIVSRSRSDGVDADVKMKMARHMDHSESTADKHYDVDTGAKFTAEFRRIFNRFHDPLDSDDDICDEDCIEPSSSLAGDRIASHSTTPSSVHSSSTKISHQPVAAQSISTKMSNSNDSKHSLVNVQIKTGMRTCTFGKPDVFTVDDKLRLFRCCADLIEKGKKKTGVGNGVTKAAILHQIRSAGQNFSDLLQNYSLSQICNRVRCEIRKK